MRSSISAGTRASSVASSELSISSLMVVSRALLGLSKPSRWRFLAKNSDTEISRWPCARVSAETPAAGFCSPPRGGALRLALAPCFVGALRFAGVLRFAGALRLLLAAREEDFPRDLCDSVDGDYKGDNTTCGFCDPPPTGGCDLGNTCDAVLHGVAD